MKAITFEGKRKVAYSDAADPRVTEATDVIVRVRAAGICGSDLHPYHEREKMDQGTIMGHEFVGEVVEVGSRVESFTKGDVVFSPFTTNCGVCFYCQSGLTCRCDSGQFFGWVYDGVGLQGSQAEYVRAPLADGTLMHVPEGVSFAAALLLGDILSTGFFCAEQAGVGLLDDNGLARAPAAPLLDASRTYAIVGCGPVGMMTILAAYYLGAEEVFVIDTIPERLATAEQMGAVALDYRVDPVADVVREATDGRGADAVMEAVGARSAMDLAVEIVRPGGVVSSVGVNTDKSFSFTPGDAYDKNLTFRSGRCPARYYMQRLAPLVGAKQIDPEFVFSHRMPLSEGVNAYQIFDQKLDGCTKVLLEL